MKIKLKVDYDEHHRKGGSGEGLPDDLKARLVKSGLADRVAERVTDAPAAVPQGEK